MSSFRSRSVVLTGGEPTLADGMPELVAALKERGFWIAVETNGTSAPDWLAFVDYVACSPKRGAPLAPRGDLRLGELPPPCPLACTRARAI